MSARIDRVAFHANLWANAPALEQLFDPTVAVYLNEQFQSLNTVSTTGDWVGTAATTGSAAVSTSVIGAVTLDAGATTAAQGYQLQRTKSAFLPAAGKDIWFEATINLTAATPPVTKAVLFVGLAESDTTIFAAGSQTTANHIGWRIATGGNLALTFASNKASTEATATAATLTAATDIKLGFWYDGTGDQVYQYVNGVQTGSAVATASVPKVVLYPSLACLSDGTDQPKLTVKALRVVQLR